MNIIDHIKKGHYDRDGYSREIVITSNISWPRARIADVDEERKTIVAYFDGWPYACTFDADGKIMSNSGSNHALGYTRLLPPEPIKMPVTRYAVYLKDGDCWSTYETKDAADRASERFPGSQVVPMTGQRTVAWK